MCMNNTFNTHGTAIYFYLRRQKPETTIFSQNGFLFLSAKTTILTRNISTPVSFLLYLACHPSCRAAAANVECRECDDKRFLLDVRSAKQQKRKQRTGGCVHKWVLVSGHKTNKQTNKQTQPFSWISVKHSVDMLSYVKNTHLIDNSSGTVFTKSH